MQRQGYVLFREASEGLYVFWETTLSAETCPWRQDCEIICWMFTTLSSWWWRSMVAIDMGPEPEGPGFRCLLIKHVTLFDFWLTSWASACWLWQGDDHSVDLMSCGKLVQVAKTYWAQTCTRHSSVCLASIFSFILTKAWWSRNYYCIDTEISAQGNKVPSPRSYSLQVSNSRSGIQT